MKKIIVLFTVLILAAGFVAADGIGFTAGVEFGIDNVTKANGGEMTPALTPMISYENSFVNGALDLYTELDYTIELVDETPMSLWFDLALGYNIKFGKYSTLSLLIENENTMVIKPEVPDGFNRVTGTLSPGLKFNQELIIGDLYAQIVMPIDYLQPVKDADLGLGLNGTVGWASTFGLGLEFTAYNSIKPDAAYDSLEICLNYTNDTIFAQLKAEIPREISDSGITLTPEFSVSLSIFTIYANCGFGGIGVDGGDMTISPAVGLQISF